MPGPFHFAWIADGDVAFDAGVHNTFDEDILTAEVQHDEGAAAILTITLKNPGVGALTIGRWCYFSFDDGSTAGIQPVFKGRLIGSPADFALEVISLQFRAIPADIKEQKTAVAAALRVLPYWDPVWFVDKIDDLDTVLEPRCAVWHVDRLTHQVTASSLIAGEDGTIDINDQLYDSVKTGFGATPLRRMVVSGTVTWKQQGQGDVDLTTPVWEAFKPTGSPFNWPQVGSFTSDGLASDWPKPLDNLGGGWSVAATAVLDTAGFAQFWVYPKSYSALDETKEADQQQVGWTILNFTSPVEDVYKTFAVAFTVAPLLQNFITHWDASRDRSEKFTFTLEADIQPQAVDLDADDEEKLDLTSDNIGEGIELDGSLPIEDLRHNSYFPRPRGSQSLQCAMLLAAAKMNARARSVTGEFMLKGWPAAALALSCRKSVLLHDRRLPGAQALGKIISYKLTMAPGRLTTWVKFASTVGYGIALPAANEGTGAYAPGYAPGYDRRIGREVAVVPGVLQYDAIEAMVVDDDGVDLFNLNSTTALLEPITVDNGPNDQQAVIDIESARLGVSPDPVEVLREHPTEWEVKLVPVTGGAFYTEIPVTVAKLVIPKMIDLEAA
jgi:hypothetical protein